MQVLSSTDKYGCTCILHVLVPVAFKYLFSTCTCRYTILSGYCTSQLGRLCDLTIRALYRTADLVGGLCLNIGTAVLNRRGSELLSLRSGDSDPGAADLNLVPVNLVLTTKFRLLIFSFRRKRDHDSRS